MSISDRRELSEDGGYVLSDLSIRRTRNLTRERDARAKITIAKRLGGKMGVDMVIEMPPDFPSRKRAGARTRPAMSSVARREDSCDMVTNSHPHFFF